MAYYTFTRAQYEDMPSVRRSFLDLEKADWGGSGDDRIYYSRNSKASQYGAKKLNSKPSSGGSSSGGGNRSSSNPDRYKYSYGGRSYENRDDARAAARADQASSSSNSGGSSSSGGGSTSYIVNGNSVSQSDYNRINAAVANARQQGANLNWSAQQIQWAVDAVYNSNGVGSAPSGEAPGDVDSSGNVTPVDTGGSSSSGGGNTSITAEHQAALDNAETQGASLGWTPQQIQWAKDAVNATFTGSTPPAGDPPPGADDTTAPDDTTTPDGEDAVTPWDSSEFENTAEFKSLSEDDQQAVLSIFG